MDQGYLLLSLVNIFLLGFVGIFLLLPREPQIRSGKIPKEMKPVPLVDVLGIVFASVGFVGLMVFCSSHEMIWVPLFLLQTVLLIAAALLVILREMKWLLLLYCLSLSSLALAAIFQDELIFGFVLGTLAVGGGFIWYQQREKIVQSGNDAGMREPVFACCLALLFGVAWVGASHATLLGEAASEASLLTPVETETGPSTVLKTQLARITATPPATASPAIFLGILLGIGLILGIALLPLLFTKRKMTTLSDPLAAD